MKYPSTRKLRIKRPASLNGCFQSYSRYTREYIEEEVENYFKPFYKHWTALGKLSALMICQQHGVPFEP